MTNSIFIFFSCSLLLSLGFIQFIPSSFSDDFDDNQFEFEKVFDCNCVAFRLDDVQDYFLNEPQIKLVIYKHLYHSFTVNIVLDCMHF